jgi:ribose-phosphate pyrophosphokinase
MDLLSGSSHQQLAQDIATRIGANLLPVEISKFPNGEKRIWVKGQLSSKTVAVIQSFSDPVDEHIIEFALMTDAVKHLGAETIIGVIPWLGYSPQDKEFRKGEPVSVHVIARILQATGLTHFITVDIHSHASLAHFHIPAEELSAEELFISELKKRDLGNHTVISVDKGSMERSRNFAAKLNLPLVVLDKTRDRNTGEVQLTYVSGEVAGKTGIAIDDFVSTGSTRIAAAGMLKSMGLTKYIDCITHALLTGDTPQRLQASLVDEIIVTDTYPIPESKKFPKLTILSIAPVISKALANQT